MDSNSPIIMKAYSRSLKKIVDIDPQTGQPIGQVSGGSSNNQQQQSNPGFLESIARAFVAPAIKSAKTLATGAETAMDWFKAGTGINRNAFNEDTISKKFKLSPEEEQQVREKPLQEAVKQSAGIASYFVPAGKLAKGAGVVAKAAQGASMGAKAGGLYGLSQSKSDDLGGMAVDTVKGGFSGGAFGGVLGGAAGTLSKFKGADKVAKKSFIRPEKSIKAGPQMLAKEEELVKDLTETMGIKGNNAEEFVKNGEQVYKNLYKEVGDSIKADKSLKSFKKLEYEIRQYLEKESDNFVPDDKLQQSILNKKLAQLDKLKDKNGKLSKQAIFEFKNKLSSQLKSVFNRIDNPNGTPPTPKEEVLLDLWSKMDDYISKDPIVKEKLRQMSVWNTASEGLKKSKDTVLQAKLFNVPVTGNLNRLSQGIQSKIASASNAVGSIPEQIPRNAKDAIIKGGSMYGAGRSVQYPSDEEYVPDEETMNEVNKMLGGQEQPNLMSDEAGNQWQVINGKSYSLDGQWVFDEASDDWVENTQGIGGDNSNPEAPMSLSQYNQQLSQLAGSSSTAAVRQYGLLAKERDYYYPQEGDVPKLSEADKKFAFAKVEAQKALNELVSNKNIPVGPLSGSFIAQKGRQYIEGQKESESKFLSKVAIARTAARNALLGANMSDKEMESLLEFTFDASLPREVLKTRIESFIDSMDGYMTTIAGPEIIDQSKLRNYFFQGE